MFLGRSSSYSCESHPTLSSKVFPNASSLSAPESTSRTGALAAAIEDAAVVVEYPEEPIGIPAALLPMDVPAFMEVHIGDEIGPQGRYAIVRKLGYGSFSSVWLARDIQSAPSKYVAIKVLTRQATRLVHTGIIREARILEYIGLRSKFRHGGDKCIKLYDTFVCETARNDTGPHQCLVTEVLGMDLNHFRDRYPGRALPLPVLKLFLQHLLTSLDFIHFGCTLTHTDLRPDNVMLAAPFSDEQIMRILKEDPPEYYPPVLVLGREVRPIVSQPLPALQVPMDQLVFKLADFGHAQICEEEVTNDVSPRAFRAPEVILQCGWNFKVDVWAVGCLTFELLTGSQLFTPEGNAAEGITADDDHLLRIMKIQGRPFPTEFLAESHNRDQFLNADGTLIRMPSKSDPRTIAECIRDSKTMGDSRELVNAAAFIERCLQYVPEDRPDPIELLEDPWLQG
ncbi:kinase-like protein [Sparassis crispa]|uniref:non-specific serine/threonine protein kinase n=1 Tax=Sparassis crispa TaxID=139825 RepID=A0A401GX91_9APHY|nr:kinase-like protein [Sparassis crispa]GBE86800.1 kinase-like protein [Sparassis crispa]